MTYDADHPGKVPWSRLKNEPARAFAIFEAYLQTSPRSVRKALAVVRHRDGRDLGLHVPGGVIRQSHEWQWRRRAEAFDAHRAAEEKARFKAAEAAARRRRLAQLDRLSEGLGLRLEELAERATLEALLKLHAAEREEYAAPNAEEFDDVGLPPIEDRIKPPDPEPSNPESEDPT
jgi:acyl-CoA reductase-like NAD-dependent aldehyde dehydrogenase